MIIAKGQDLIEVKPEIIIGGIYDVELPRDTGTHILERRRPCLILCRYGEAVIYGAVPLTSEKEGKDYDNNRSTKYVPLNVDRTVLSYACINQFRPVDESMIDRNKLSGKLHPNKVKLIIRELINYVDQDNVGNAELANVKTALSKSCDEISKLKAENESLRKEVESVRLQLAATFTSKTSVPTGLTTVPRCTTTSRTVIVPAQVVESKLSNSSIVTLDKKFDIPWTSKVISALSEDDIIELFTVINKVGFKPMAKARGVNPTTLSSIKQALVSKNQKLKDMISLSKGQRGLMSNDEIEIRFVDSSETKPDENQVSSVPAELPNYRNMALTMDKALNLSLDQVKEFLEYSKVFNISQIAEAYGISNTVTASKIRSRLVSKVQDSKRNIFVNA